MTTGILVTCTLIAGITGFIAGLTVELVANADALRNAKEEVKRLKRQLTIVENQLNNAAEPVEIIEINDNRVNTDTLFDPW